MWVSAVGRAVMISCPPCSFIYAYVVFYECLMMLAVILRGETVIGTSTGKESFVLLPKDPSEEIQL